MLIQSSSHVDRTRVAVRNSIQSSPHDLYGDSAFPELALASFEAANMCRLPETDRASLATRLNSSILHLVRA